MLGKNNSELIRLIDFAIKDEKIWAVELYVKWNNNVNWLSHAIYKAAVSNSIHTLRFLEKNRLFESYMAELVICRAAQFNCYKTLQHLLDNYAVRSVKEIFTYGFYFTYPKTHEIIANHPKITPYLYRPYSHDNYNYTYHVNIVLQREREKRQRRNWRLMYLYVFLLRWAREVKARPGNSDYLEAMRRFYQMVAEDERPCSLLEHTSSQPILEAQPI